MRQALNSTLASLDSDLHAEVLVLGAGPGGYTAAFRAADLGLKTTLVERYERLGGVCLNVGCIPSKALLHIARVIAEAEEAGEAGVSFGAPQIDLDALRAWKAGVVDRLTGGLGGLARQRKVEVVQGTGHFTGPHTLDVDGREITFEHAIVAVGSSPVESITRGSSCGTPGSCTEREPAATIALSKEMVVV